MGALTPCSRRAYEVDARRRCRFPYRKRVENLFLRGIVLAAFVCQITFLLSDYLERSTFWTQEEIADPPARFPPFTVCPWPSFNPFRLMNLGFNSSVATGKELVFNYENLIGIDDGLPGRRLVEEAAWRLEEIVEEVMVGDVHEVYNTTNASSLLWQLTFNLIGPCLTLISPPLSSLSSKSLMVKLRKSDLERCKWKENGSTHLYGGPEDCSDVRKYCNTSCAWEQFVKDEYYRMNFLYLGSTSIVLNVHYLSTDMRMCPQSNSQVQADPYHIVRVSDTEVPSRLCFQECMVKEAERKERCRGLFRSSTQEPIQNLCIKQSQQYSLLEEFIAESLMYNKCKRSCKPDKREIRWVLSKAPSNSPQSSIIVVNLSSNSYTTLTEKEVYPLSQFMSDVGGSLGLFLGISLLSMWDEIVNAAKSIGAQSGNPLMGKYLRLTTLSGQVAISLVACLHLWLVLFEYRSQALITKVTLQKSTEGISKVSRYDILKNSTEGENQISDLLITHLASRPLGCKVIPQSSEVSCFVRCILQGSIKFPTPLAGTDDLPQCTQDHLSLPRKKYIISNEINKNFVRESQKLCNTKCSNSENNARENQPIINASIEQNFGISKISLICTLGGIIGLYYGFSLLQILPSSDSVCLTRLITKSTYNIAKLTIQTSISFAGIVLTMLQVQSFLFDHPVTTSYSSRPLESRDLPAFTVCVWPPFSMGRILEKAGFDEAYRIEQRLNTTSTNKRASIISLFRKLQETQNSTSLDHLWDLAAWSKQELEISVTSYNMYECSEYSKNVGDIFHSCHTYITGYTDEVYKGAFCNALVSAPKEAKVILSIHSLHDLPVMETDVVLHDRTDISIDQFSLWSGLQGDSRGWGKCVSECLDGALRKKMGCVLPWSASRGGDPTCNVDQYIELLGNLWSIESRPQHIYSALHGAQVTNACRHKCHQKSGVFYGFQLHGEKHIAPSFTTQLIPSNNSQSVFAHLTISTGTFESVTEHDGFPVSKLLCDIGGVAGMTVGFSLASLIDVVWKVLKQKERY